jgi:NAD(P)-dependent dehydrogenase (short-subunit alcohol dehydrogenase family)
MAQHLSGPSSLTGQVALITGGAGGMGHAIANVFKAAGARVVATDLGEHEDIGHGIEYRRYDVTSRAHTDKVIDGVLADHGKSHSPQRRYASERIASVVFHSHRLAPNQRSRSRRCAPFG